MFNLLNGVPGAIRTLDRTLRRRMLYPTELLGQISLDIKNYNLFYLLLQVFLKKNTCSFAG